MITAPIPEQTNMTLWGSVRKASLAFSTAALANSAAKLSKAPGKALAMR